MIVNEQTLWLAALLHDIGKFSQRLGGDYHAKHAEFGGDFIASLQDYFGKDPADAVAKLVSTHHKPALSREELILQLADKLSASEREQEPRDRLKSNEATLVSVASRVEFREHREPSGGEKFFSLNRLQIKREILFPGDRNRVEPKAYRDLWEEFVARIRRLPPYQLPSNFITLYSLLQEFGTFIPSATPWEEEEHNRTVPDVSLFEHSKTTCAIAACLGKLNEDELADNELRELLELLRDYRSEDFEERFRENEVAQRPLFLLVRGDMSGIQNFLYRITKPEAETRGTAKRLRGRSFYLTLMNEVIADWIIRHFELPPANILFCGGGRFDLLLPRKVTDQLEQVERKIEDWLLREFYGELGLQIAQIEVTPRDFLNFSRLYRDLENSLVRKKGTKFYYSLTESDFFNLTQALHDVCPYCQVTPLREGEETFCKACKLQKEMGGHLPRTEFIAYVYNPTTYNLTPLNDKIVWAPFRDLGVTVGLISKKLTAGELKEFLRYLTSLSEEVILYKMNTKMNITDNYLPFEVGEPQIPKNIGFGFKFLGNAAPVALKRLDLIKGKEPVNPDEVLDFEEIAELSEGAKLLGVLKMDVDHLGLLFGLGVEPQTISRISTLSSSFELFFGAWLNELCRQVTVDWETGLPPNDLRHGAVESLFYVVYSGGDDLLVVGPWDRTIKLAQEIYNDFWEYTGQNPNITMSGGILLVKPHFPIHRFAQLVGEELEQSKGKGRDRITLFRETVKWKDNEKGFDQLIKFGEELANYVERKELPKTFVYFLLQLHKQHFDREKKQDLRWVPKFFYALIRRVRKEVMDNLELQTRVLRFMEHIRIPVSYVSLKTRG